TPISVRLLQGTYNHSLCVCPQDACRRIRTPASLTNKIIMKKNPASKSGFFNPRLLFAFALCSVGVLLALLGLGVYPGASAFAQGPKQNQSSIGVQVGASYH